MAGELKERDGFSGMKENIREFILILHYFESNITTMKNNSSFKSLWLIIPVALLLLTGCANNEDVKSCLTGHTYGFLGGLWHGFIAPFDFIGMLFNDEITLYAQNNNGGLYALGFLMGSGGWGFFGGKGAKSVYRRKTTYTNPDRFDKAEVVE